MIIETGIHSVVQPLREKKKKKRKPSQDSRIAGNYPQSKGMKIAKLGLGNPKLNSSSQVFSLLGTELENEKQKTWTEIMESILLKWTRTWYEEKMVGWSSLTSNVGITTFVKVWCNRVAPSFSLTRECRYFPSYFGPANAFSIFATSNLQLQENERVSQLQMRTIDVKKHTYPEFNDPCVWWDPYDWEY